jgi:hypothetical protein
MASGTAAAVTGDPTTITKSLVNVDPSILQLSDEELAETPEHEWIRIIPAARLARMINTGIYEYDREIQYKFEKALIYGISYMQEEPVLQMMVKALDKVGYSPKNMLREALTMSLGDNFNGGAREMFGNPEHISQFRPNWLIKHVSEIFKEANVEMTPDIKQFTRKHEYAIAKKNHIDLRQKEQRSEKIISRPDDNLASPMHQPFESKLTKALLSIKD